MKQSFTAKEIREAIDYIKKCYARNEFSPVGYQFVLDAVLETLELSKLNLSPEQGKEENDEEKCICGYIGGRPRCPIHRKEPPPEKVGEANFLQVGRAVACGHCEPEKFSEGLKQAERVFPNYKCNCVCHDSPTPKKGRPKKKSKK